MPGMNKTGPQGKGPMTGRGMGVCHNPDVDDTDRPRGLLNRLGRKAGNRLRQRNRFRQNGSGRGRQNRFGNEPVG